MQISSYTKRVILICSVLSIAIIGLSSALYSQGPRVRFIQGIEDIQGRHLTADSGIQIVFDRPIEQRDYSEFISISPEANFTVRTNTQSITMALQTNLRSNTEYNISVRPEIYDKSGKKMKNSYSHSFSTVQPSYIYLERNYGLDPNTEFSLTGEYTDAADHIKLSTPGSEPEILFSRPQIRSFAANNDYLVVAVKEAKDDELYTINLNTKEVRKERLLARGRINDLALSPRSQTALFTTQPEFNSVTPEYFEKYESRIESINLSDGATVYLTDVNEEPLKAYDLDTDISGQIALIQDAQQTYYAVSPFNDFDPVLIGSYLDTFGFSSNGAEILFRDRNELVRYDVTSAETVPIDFDDSGYILDITSRDDVYSFSSTAYLLDSSYSSVDRFSDWSGEPETLWRSNSSDTSTLTQFTPSYDNAFLALQFTPAKCQYDDIGTHSECKDVFQQIVDPETGDTLEDFRGSNVVWLP